MLKQYIAHKSEEQKETYRHPPFFEDAEGEPQHQNKQQCKDQSIEGKALDEKQADNETRIQNDPDFRRQNFSFSNVCDSLPAQLFGQEKQI